MYYFYHRVFYTTTCAALLAFAAASSSGNALAELKHPAWENAAPVQLAADPDSAEHAHWTAIQSSNNSKDFIAFLAHYPDSVFAPIATSRLLTLLNEEAKKTAPLDEESEWKTAKSSKDPARLQKFLEAYPNSTHRAEARVLLATLNVAPEQGSTGNSQNDETALWQAAKTSDSRADYKAYLNAYPQGRYASIAKARIVASQSTSTQSTTQSASIGNTNSAATAGTGEYRFDGLWSITATHLHSPYGRIPFCRSRETMRATFTVKYGEFEQQSRTNKGAPVNIEGSFSSSGKLKLDVIPWGPKESGGWGNNVERGDLRIEENMNGKQRVRKTVGEDCKVELVLVRQ